jgi:hypothetical protein
MKGSIENMREELKDDAAFKSIYLFSFGFGLGENQKSLRKSYDLTVIILVTHNHLQCNVCIDRVVRCI